MTRLKIQNLHSSVKGKSPTVSTSDTDSIQYGEIAVNYAKGSETLAIRNASDEIVTFPNSNTFRYGCTNVTTLVNVPIKTKLVYTSLTANDTLSIDTSSYSDIFTAFPDGVEMKIIAYNSGSSSITITLPWDTYTCFAKSLTVNTGEYGIIDISFKSETEVYILAEVQKQAQADYDGKYSIVAFSNGTDYQLIKDKDNNLSDFKAAHSDYEPIGILIIPSSGTSIMLPDGDVRKGKNIIMSLCDMSYTTPDSGTTNVEAIYFGGGVNTGLTIYNIINYYSDGTTQSTISTTENAYLPSDIHSDGTVSKVYPSIYYDATSDLAPCPFKQVDGELLPNEEYYTTAYSSQNAFSDFAGPNNTKAYIDSATAQTDWKTKGVAITSSTDSGYYPAACCCARFGAPDNSSAPKGTNSFLYHYNNNPSYDYTKGVNYTWYFPAIGEFGFATPHFKKNNATLTKLASLYSDMNIVSIDTDQCYFCSTYWDGYLTHVFYPAIIITASAFYNVASVRAFCAI